MSLFSDISDAADKTIDEWEAKLQEAEAEADRKKAEAESEEAKVKIERDLKDTHDKIRSKIDELKQKLTADES